MGIGTELLRQMLELLRNDGYKSVSLSVQKANYALKMYEKAGFRIVSQDVEEAIMVCPLTESL
jgi:ribosomal protein S18 acetylase RimI-like enzyme